MNEEWRPIPGFEEAYSISDWGRVRSEKRTVQHPDGSLHPVRERLLKINTHPFGYPQVSINSNGKRHTHPIYRLMAWAFLGPVPPKQEVLHNDGNPSNTTLSNLRYGTRAENMQDCLRHGRHKSANKTECNSGHKFDSENTALIPGQNNARRCKECHRAARRRHDAKLRQDV